ncbi:phenylalanine--tRNA ligase subunit alpha [Caloramator proteoclasticus]|uniref:Phenylalanine--tRNA ligase alpha subunit n=1 Tax=Caloramator proteoclasticus DSM 10124 TaxID=1121262 RepID=A0A1M4XE05_9CLOT|nr:phenylalanine--tRNA ligase subunit alpha [Caloramator proteoclasticus]SHE91492.1 phenylalanyl-tRNA synthetase, alpha subunit [Caloramator proteoclasticus DSM 10124]
MREKLQQIKEEALLKLKECQNSQMLDELRVKYLGKKGELTTILRGMGQLSPEERPTVGKIANEVREEIEAAIEETLKQIKQREKNLRLSMETIDVTMPGRANRIGGLHPLTKALDEIKEIFIGMGFSIAEGPEVELDYYNFEALNIPKNHPARDEQDTFYINQNVVLRTQTSPVQIRVMENKKPPIRIIAPGRVYRSDTADATHSPIFHQVEGLVVDKGITMASLKGTLDAFAKRMFGEKTRTKFRPHHFPFTEPSAEVDVSCFVCGGTGCRVCKGSGWIEILGCGMVHPDVLRAGGIDPEVYSGFAFGLGLERIVMIKYGIDDIRLFYENDVRFLKQF